MLLLKAGADPRAKPQGKTALHVACEAGHEEVARALLAADPASISSECTHRGRTPLDLAREADLLSLAKRLEAFANELETP